MYAECINWQFVDLYSVILYSLLWLPVGRSSNLGPTTMAVVQEGRLKIRIR